MRPYSAVVAALLFGAAHANSEMVEVAPFHAFLDLTDDTFHDFIEDKALAVVYFHAPWCLQCRNYYEEYSRTAGLLDELEIDIPLVAVDGSQNRKLVDEFQIHRYPTIQIFRHGQGNLYHGPRYYHKMQTYLQNKMVSNITAISSEDELALFRDKQNEMPTAVYFGTHDDDDSYKKFDDMCLALSETLSCGKADFVSEYGSGGILLKPTKWKSKSDEMAVEIEGSTPLAMAAFVDSNRLPLVSVRSAYTDRYLKATTRPIVTMLYNLDFEADPKGTNYFANRLRRVAKGFAGRATFLIEDGNEKSYRQYGLQGVYTPDSSEFIVVITHGAQERWVYSGLVGQNKRAFNAEELGDYLEGIMNVGSESRPNMFRPSTDHTQQFYQDDWDYEKEESVSLKQSSIFTVTANTFDEVVTNGNRDVFMMFAAPWCVHCIQFLEVYEPIAKNHLKSKSGPIIAQMDADKNFVSDDFDIQGYPSFFWIPKGGKAPTRYTGGYRDKEEIEKFLQSMRKVRSTLSR